MSWRRRRDLVRAVVVNRMAVTLIVGVTFEKVWSWFGQVQWTVLVVGWGIAGLFAFSGCAKPHL